MRREHAKKILFTSETLSGELNDNSPAIIKESF